MGVLFRMKRIFPAVLSSIVGVLLLGCSMPAIHLMRDAHPAKTFHPPTATATYFTPTITLSPTSTLTPTATDVPPTSTPTLTITPTPSNTPTPTVTRRPPAPTPANKVVPTSLDPPAHTPQNLPTQTPGNSQPQLPGPSATPYIVPTPSDPGRTPILTIGACNTVERGYIWGPPNVATRGGFESRTLMMTEWAPPECRPDAANPARPPRALTVAECAMYYYKPAVLILFPTRPFDGLAYYDDVAGLIRHIESYEDEIGLQRSKKVAIGPVSYEGGGVIGSPTSVLVLGAGVVNLPDIILKTRDVSGFMAASDNVHLISSSYFFGIVNAVVFRAVAGANTVYTVETSEIPPYVP